MQLEKPSVQCVRVQVVDASERKSSSLTVYGSSRREVIETIRRAVKAQADVSFPPALSHVEGSPN